MRIQDISYHNDGNYITEDGTTYVMHYLNPARKETGQPEYITQKIPIDNNEGWVAAYQNDQHEWATSNERETGNRVDVSGMAVKDGEDPMQVLFNLIEDEETNPEVVLGYCEQLEESEEKRKLVELLLKYKEHLPATWQELLDKHYGEQMRFSDICREDLETKGIVKTNQAYSKQHNKAIDKLKDSFEKAGFEVDRTSKKKSK